MTVSIGPRLCGFTIDDIREGDVFVPYPAFSLEYENFK